MIYIYIYVCGCVLHIRILYICIYLYYVLLSYLYLFSFLRVFVCVCSIGGLWEAKPSGPRRFDIGVDGSRPSQTVDLGQTDLKILKTHSESQIKCNNKI